MDGCGNLMKLISFVSPSFRENTVSGQGPYFGQTTWFRKFHPEKVPSARQRYDEQLVRVVGVLDRILQGKTWLVGDK